MPEQVWPAFANAPHTQPETALATFASAQTICGSLPPSSSTEPFISRAQTSPTLRPTSTEPVKKTLPTRVAFADRLADRAAAVDGADQPLWQAAVLERRLDSLAQQRSQAGGLQDDAVSAHQGDRNLAEGDRPRVIPGRDHADDADRLVAEEAALGLHEQLRVGNRLVGEDLRPALGDPVQGVDRRQQLHREALGQRLALLGAEQAGDLVDLVDQDVGGAQHVASAVGERELRPEGLHLARSRRRPRRARRARSCSTAPSDSPVAGLKDSSSPIRRDSMDEPSSVAASASDPAQLRQPLGQLALLAVLGRLVEALVLEAGRQPAAGPRRPSAGRADRRSPGRGRASPRRRSASRADGRAEAGRRARGRGHGRRRCPSSPRSTSARAPCRSPPGRGSAAPRAFRSGRRPAPAAVATESARGSALPMSSEARMTIRRTMKRGSSPPSSIAAR